MMEEAQQLWKAVWFGLAGIPLGFAIGGELTGVIAATVLVSVAGAANWGRHHMCEPRSHGVPGRAYAAVAGAAVAVVAVHTVLPFLLPAVAALAVLAAGSVPVMRHLARRACVPRWSAAYRPPARRRRRQPVQRAAITTGQRALERGRIEVTPGMVLGKAKEEAR